jgi:hypothetical protein
MSERAVMFVVVVVASVFTLGMLTVLDALLSGLGY